MNLNLNTFCFFLFIYQICISQNIYAQFYVVQDKDGYVLVRQVGVKQAAVMDTLWNGDVVFSLEPVGNWINIEYDKNGTMKNGYVYFNRLKNILDYTKIPTTNIGKGLIVLEKQKDSLSISIKTQKFMKKGHRLTYSKVNYGMLEKIDSKQYWGCDGGLPSMAYQSISITIESQQYELPHSAFSDLFQPSLSNTIAHYDLINDRLFIKSSNSDGAGGYEVIWLIEKGIYKNRLVVHGF